MQQHCIAMNGTFFNTHRMLAQYFSNAYLPPSEVGAISDLEEFSHQPVDTAIAGVQQEAALV